MYVALVVLITANIFGQTVPPCGLEIIRYTISINVLEPCNRTENRSGVKPGTINTVSI